MTKMTVYDYESNPVDIKLPDTPISMIVVTVLSGDETGTILFEDGTEIKFNSCNSRFRSFYDGTYIVRGDNIKKWLEFVPTDGRTASYERQNIFSRSGCEDND